MSSMPALPDALIISDTFQLDLIHTLSPLFRNKKTSPNLLYKPEPKYLYLKF